MTDLTQTNPFFTGQRPDLPLPPLLATRTQITKRTQSVRPPGRPPAPLTAAAPLVKNKANSNLNSTPRADRRRARPAELRNEPKFYSRPPGSARPREKQSQFQPGFHPEGRSPPSASGQITKQSQSHFRTP